MVPEWKTATVSKGRVCTRVAKSETFCKAAPCGRPQFGLVSEWRVTAEYGGEPRSRADSCGGAGHKVNLVASNCT